LKTPLTTIKGFVQVLDRLKPKDASEKFNQTLAKISKYIDRLNNLITELLDVSKLQSGNIELHHDKFDFDKMVIETIENLKISAGRHKINLQGKLGLEVMGDESQIVQVINNLVSNAIKYAPESTDVEVYVSRVGEYAKVAVTDHGLGINLEDQPKVFERFFRSGDIQKRYPGMGIGLYICQQIIKNHGGTIWVVSEKNQGSTFSFTLPISGEVKNVN